MGQGPERVAAGGVDVASVDGDLPVQAGNSFERVLDGRGWNGYDDDIGAVRVAAVTAHGGDVVSGCAPKLGQTAANASASDNSDVHETTFERFVCGVAHRRRATMCRFLAPQSKVARSRKGASCFRASSGVTTSCGASFSYV